MAPSTEAVLTFCWLALPRMLWFFVDSRTISSGGNHRPYRIVTNMRGMTGLVVRL
jgi:hypothetical protein